MFKPILVWFGFLAVVRYQTLFLEEVWFGLVWFNAAGTTVTLLFVLV